MHVEDTSKGMLCHVEQRNLLKECNPPPLSQPASKNQPPLSIVYSQQLEPLNFTIL